MVKLSILFTLFTGKSPQRSLKIGRTIIFVGIATVIMGIIFHLQGQSIIGPESSVMYSNPDWTRYGLQISECGIILAAIGLVWAFVKRN